MKYRQCRLLEILEQANPKMLRLRYANPVFRLHAALLRLRQL
jgi:hypothetical protein